MTCHNCIVSSQANDYFAHNSPSQFKCRRPDNLLLDQELDWSMALKGCSIPNRFNTITSDGTCSITVKKILLGPGDDPEELASADQLDRGEVTVYIKPGCYLTAESLAEAITNSFTESGLPLECTLVSKVVEILRRRESGEPKTYPVISNSSSSFVAPMLRALKEMLSTVETLLADNYSDCEVAVGDAVGLIRRAGQTADVRLNVRPLVSPLLAIRETPTNDNDDDSDDSNDEREYFFIGISPALAAICGFAPSPLAPMNVSLSPVVSREGLLNVTTSYPKQFLLCSDALQKSYIVKSGDFDPQRLLYHFTAPDPRKHALIKIGHGIGHDIPLTHLKFSSLHFSMRDLDGRHLEIDSENPTWLDLRLSSARK